MYRNLTEKKAALAGKYSQLNKGLKQIEEVWDELNKLEQKDTWAAILMDSDRAAIEENIKETEQVIEEWKRVEDKCSTKIALYEEMVQECKTLPPLSYKEGLYKDLYFAQKKQDEACRRLAVFKKHVGDLMYLRENCPKCRGTGKAVVTMAASYYSPADLIPVPCVCCYEEAPREKQEVA